MSGWFKCKDCLYFNELSGKCTLLGYGFMAKPVDPEQEACGDFFWVGAEG